MNVKFKCIQELLVLLICTLLLIGCKKEDDPEDDQTDQLPANTLVINGVESTIPNFFANLGYNNSLVLGGSTSTGEEISIYLDDFIGQAEYPIVDDNIATVIDSSGINFTTYIAVNSGSVNITSYNANTHVISGTFFFNAIGAGTTTEVQEGIFTNVSIAMPNYIDQSEALVISDFEMGVNADWYINVVGDDVVIETSDQYDAPVNDNALHCSTSLTSDYLTFVMYFDSQYAEQSPGVHFALSDNAEDVYINFYAKAPTDIDFINLTFYEDDDNNGDFNNETEDIFVYRIENIEPGWQLYSVKYADFDHSEFYIEGNWDPEPHKLTNLSFNFITNAMGPKEVLVDFIAFTEGGSLAQ